MTNFAVGTGASLEGYPATALQARSGTAYQAEPAVSLDVDGSVSVPVVHTGGLFNVPINGTTGANPGAAGGLPAGCIKATSGRLAKAQVTTAATGGALKIYDNAAGDNTGTVVAVIKSNAAIGDQYSFDMPIRVGISCPGLVSAANITLGYS